MDIFIVVVMTDGSRMTKTTSFDPMKWLDWKRAMRLAGSWFEPHREDIRSIVTFTGVDVSQYANSEVAEIFGWEG